MRTLERLCGDVVVLDLHGTLAPRSVDVDLWKTVRDLSARGHRKLVLNLVDATSANGFAVSTLLGAMQEARQAGDEVKLVQAARRLNNLQILVALCDHFEVFEREQDALASFGGDARAVRDVAVTGPGVAHVAWGRS